MNKQHKKIQPIVALLIVVLMVLVPIAAFAANSGDITVEGGSDGTETDGSTGSSDDGSSDSGETGGGGTEPTAGGTESSGDGTDDSGGDTADGGTPEGDTTGGDTGGDGTSEGDAGGGDGETGSGDEGNEPGSEDTDGSDDEEPSDSGSDDASDSNGADDGDGDDDEDQAGAGDSENGDNDGSEPEAVLPETEVLSNDGSSDDEVETDYNEGQDDTGANSYQATATYYQEQNPANPDDPTDLLTYFRIVFQEVGDKQIAAVRIDPIYGDFDDYSLESAISYSADGTQLGSWSINQGTDFFEIYASDINHAVDKVSDTESLYYGLSGWLDVTLKYLSAFEEATATFKTTAWVTNDPAQWYETDGSINLNTVNAPSSDAGWAEEYITKTVIETRNEQAIGGEYDHSNLSTFTGVFGDWNGSDNGKVDPPTEVGYVDVTVGSETVRVYYTTEKIGGELKNLNWYITEADINKGYVVTDVFVKGGNTANVYTYTGGSISGGELNAPANNSGNYAEISHFGFKLSKLGVKEITETEVYNVGAVVAALDANEGGPGEGEGGPDEGEGGPGEGEGGPGEGEGGTDDTAVLPGFDFAPFFFAPVAPAAPPAPPAPLLLAAAPATDTVVVTPAPPNTLPTPVSEELAPEEPQVSPLQAGFPWWPLLLIIPGLFWLLLARLVLVRVPNKDGEYETVARKLARRKDKRWYVDIEKELDKHLQKYGEVMVDFRGGLIKEADKAIYSGDNLLSRGDVRYALVSRTRLITWVEKLNEQLSKTAG